MLFLSVTEDSSWTELYGIELIAFCESKSGYYPGYWTRQEKYYIHTVVADTIQLIKLNLSFCIYFKVFF